MGILFSRRRSKSDNTNDIAKQYNEDGNSEPPPYDESSDLLSMLAKFEDSCEKSKYRAFAECYEKEHPIMYFYWANYKIGYKFNGKVLILQGSSGNWKICEADQQHIALSVFNLCAQGNCSGEWEKISIGSGSYEIPDNTLPISNGILALLNGKVAKLTVVDNIVKISLFCDEGKRTCNIEPDDYVHIYKTCIPMILSQDNNCTYFIKYKQGAPVITKFDKDLS